MTNTTINVTASPVHPLNRETFKIQIFGSLDPAIALDEDAMSLDDQIRYQIECGARYGRVYGYDWRVIESS